MLVGMLLQSCADSQQVYLGPEMQASPIGGYFWGYALKSHRYIYNNINDLN